MSQLRLLVEDTVGSDEIDRNGHLNVRFYSARAMRATRALAESLGLDDLACRRSGGLLLVTDAFTRYHREQLVGAPLAVRGGLIGVAADRLRLYHELSNRSTGELAASFVHEARLLDRQSGAFTGLPEPLGGGLADVVPWPERGMPHSLDLDRPPKDLALAEARRRGLTLRQDRSIGPGECDAEGLLLPERQADLFWGGPPARQTSEAPSRGWRPGFGWVTLESRSVCLRLPRVGTRIQSFGAEVEVGRKTTHRRHWAFDADRGDVLAVTSMINLGFDVVARRSREIPPDVRDELEADHHPDLI